MFSPIQHFLSMGLLFAGEKAAALPQMDSKLAELFFVWYTKKLSKNLRLETRHPNPYFPRTLWNMPFQPLISSYTLKHTITTPTSLVQSETRHRNPYFPRTLWSTPSQPLLPSYTLKHAIPNPASLVHSETRYINLYFPRTLWNTPSQPLLPLYTLKHAIPTSYSLVHS